MTSARHFRSTELGSLLCECVERHTPSSLGRPQVGTCCNLFLGSPPKVQTQNKIISALLLESSALNKKPLLLYNTMLKLQQYCCALSCVLCTTRVHCSQKPSLATWLSQAGLLHGAIDQVNPFLIPYRFFERAKDVRDERAVAGRSSNSLGIVGRARRELVGQVVARLLHGAGQKRGSSVPYVS